MARGTKPDIEECAMTMPSKALPDHTHTCTGNHDSDQDHFCGECRRYWWVKVLESSPGPAPRKSRKKNG